jgi:hypothetical protein
VGVFFFKGFGWKSVKLAQLRCYPQWKEVRQSPKLLQQNFAIRWWYGFAWASWSGIPEIHVWSAQIEARRHPKGQQTKLGFIAEDVSSQDKNLFETIANYFKCLHGAYIRNGDVPGDM